MSAWTFPTVSSYGPSPNASAPSSGSTATFFTACPAWPGSRSGRSIGPCLANRQSPAACSPFRPSANSSTITRTSTAWSPTAPSPPTGQFLPLPQNLGPEPFLRLWEHKVFALLLADKKINEALVDQLRSWRQSGFGVDRSVRLAAGDRGGIENLAQYLARSPFSLGRLVRISESGQVVYRAQHDRPQRFPDPASEELAAGVSRNFQVFQPLEFLAELFQHIPNKGEHLIRYYGHYSNKARGMQARQAALSAAGSEDVGRASCPPKCSALPAGGGDQTQPASQQPQAGPSASPVPPAPSRWAILIKRVYDAEPLLCPQCGATMRIISFIEARQDDVIRRILKHCGLWEEFPASRPPPPLLPAPSGRPGPGLPAGGPLRSRPQLRRTDPPGRLLPAGTALVTPNFLQSRHLTVPRWGGIFFPACDFRPPAEVVAAGTPRGSFHSCPGQPSSCLRRRVLRTGADMGRAPDKAREGGQPPPPPRPPAPTPPPSVLRTKSNFLSLSSPKMVFRTWDFFRGDRRASSNRIRRGRRHPRPFHKEHTMRAICAIFALGLLCVPSFGQTAQPARLPVPDDKVLQKARVQVTDVFAKDIASAKTAEQRAALVEQMLATAQTGQPANVYALYEAAATLASLPDVGRRRDATLFWTVIEKWTEAFDVPLPVLGPCSPRAERP